MSQMTSFPPHSTAEPVTEIFHGVSVTDSYRWLEEQNSPRTRAWIEEQTKYARHHLDNIPGRRQVHQRIRELLATEAYDSLQMAGGRYFFRKRLPNQEQPCIYMREGTGGKDHLLIDPSERATGEHTAIKPLGSSLDGTLLLYEVKEGGEKTGSFELLEVATRRRLPEFLPRGYLRGFAFAPDGKSFYYVHEALGAQQPFYRAAYRHVLGTPVSEDREVFFAGEGPRIILCLKSDKKRIAFLVYRFLERTFTDVYLQDFGDIAAPKMLFRGIDYLLGMRLMGRKILALTDLGAPNRKIVEFRLEESVQHSWKDVVPESDARIAGWAATENAIYVSYLKEMRYRVSIFDPVGKQVGEIPFRSDETVRLAGDSADGDELILETESFTEPIAIFRYSRRTNERSLWAKRTIPFESTKYEHSQIWFRSKDGTRVPMYLVGRPDVLNGQGNPTIMTSYGGYGISVTPQFSVFVAFLLERGCLFAVPNIRGGSEFGADWHEAGRGRNRQTAFNDFLCAAESLVESGRTAPQRLAIFGGSNAGLLVGAALTQRPELFGAAVCMVPLLDMLRYHLFDHAYAWKAEFGTADDPEDFAALAKYSPYHQVRHGVTYPATMIVSGDEDQSCNPLHARKMTAQLQMANSSGSPILLVYSKFRGHSAVLPLSERIDALTDRMAFLCEQLQLPTQTLAEV